MVQWTMASGSSVIDLDIPIRNTGLDKPKTVCYTEAKLEETLIAKNVAFRTGFQQHKGVGTHRKEHFRR